MKNKPKTNLITGNKNKSKKRGTNSKKTPIKRKEIEKKQDSKINPKPTKPKLNYFLLISISLIIIALALNLLFYEQLPPLMTTHWNYAGEGDGFTPKETGVLLIPIISTIIFVFMNYLPKIDPLKKNILEFKKEYDFVITNTIFFLFYTNLITLILNLGIKIDIRQLIVPAFFVLFYNMGFLLKKAKRNFFIGVKTPWTLSSDKVWNKTHKKASKLFQASAILTLIGLIIPELALFFILVPIIISSISLIIYSYFEYKKVEEK